MLYIKNGEFRDSKKYLVTSDGRTIFNATPEQWEAEGWEEYVPEIKQEDELEKSLSQLKEELIIDAKSFVEDFSRVPLSREERIFLRLKANDLIEEGISQAPVLNNQDRYVDLRSLTQYLKDLNVVETHNQMVLNDHILAIKNLETRNEVDRYDYTTGYSKLPKFEEIF